MTVMTLQFSFHYPNRVRSTSGPPGLLFLLFENDARVFVILLISIEIFLGKDRFGCYLFVDRCRWEG